MVYENIITPLAALALFLYGIEHLTLELQERAKDQFREWLTKAATNRFSGALIGLATTAIVQSSTATTIITVGLVDSGILSFRQALGIMAGSNVGTTLTAQLVAFKITAFAPWFLLIGFILSLTGKRYQAWGKAIFYFGLVLFGLDYLGIAIEPWKSDPALLTFISHLTSPILGILIGALITIIFNSSAVTTGLIVVLGQQQILTLHIAIPLLLGANIGTTSTTLLMSLRQDLFAKRTAIAHTLFNIGGVLIFLPFLTQFTQLMSAFDNLGVSIAMSHTAFNIITAGIFLLALPMWEKAAKTLIKGEEQEILYKTYYVQDAKGVQSTLTAVKKELKHQMDIIKELFDTAHTMLLDEKDKITKVRKLENISDYLDDAISNSLILASREKTTKKAAEHIYTYTQLSNEAEQVADFGEDYADIAEKIATTELSLYPESKEELRNIYTHLLSNMADTKKLITKKNKHIYNRMKRRTSTMNKLINKSYKRQIRYIAKETAASFTGSAFVDAVAALESANAKLLDMAHLLMQI